MLVSEKKDLLTLIKKFKLVGKYKTFYRIAPGVMFASHDQMIIVENLLNDCSRELINILESQKRPRKTDMKKACVICMDAITAAAISTENREFAYELCWYLADKTRIDLIKTSGKKKWGYFTPKITNW